MTAVPRTDLDITAEGAVLDAVAGHDVVVNCAAWTAVDDAEARESDAFLVNAVGRPLHRQDCLAVGAYGNCFPKTIARVATEKGAVSVVTDQVGQPTWTADVADFVHRLAVSSAPSGTFHATSSDAGSWFDFAQEVCESAGPGRDVVSPTTSDDVVRPAPRPAYSVLDHSAAERAGVRPIGHWRKRWHVAAASVLAMEKPAVSQRSAG